MTVLAVVGVGAVLWLLLCVVALSSIVSEGSEEAAREEPRRPAELGAPAQTPVPTA